MKYFLFIFLVILKNNLSAQPIQPIPLNGYISPSSPFSDWVQSYQKYYLYQVDFDVKVNKVTLTARATATNPGCCIRTHVNIAFYNYQGKLLYEKIGSLLDVEQFPKNSLGDFLIQINLDSPLLLSRGFYFIGFSSTPNQGENFNATSGTNCKCVYYGLSYICSGSNMTSNNCNNTATKNYLIYYTNSIHFPAYIPTGDKTVPCFPNHPAENNWYTFQSASFPILIFN